MKNNDHQDLLAGQNLASILNIPPFLRRERHEDEMSDIPYIINKAPPAFSDDPTPPDQELLLPEEKLPTFEELVATIRKLDAKISEWTEQKRILKKQADAMWKKL